MIRGDLQGRPEYTGNAIIPPEINIASFVAPDGRG
jgi:hypothetical protein